jgi:hypothetical protein
MNTATLLDRAEFDLAARALVDIPDISGMQVICRRGSLWITLDNDPRDIVLEAGESFFSTEHRRALVYAFQASVVDMRAVAAPDAARARPVTSAPWLLLAVGEST